MVRGRMPVMKSYEKDQSKSRQPSWPWRFTRGTHFFSDPCTWIFLFWLSIEFRIRMETNRHFCFRRKSLGYGFVCNPRKTDGWIIHAFVRTCVVVRLHSCQTGNKSPVNSSEANVPTMERPQPLNFLLASKNEIECFDEWKCGESNCPSTSQLTWGSYQAKCKYYKYYTYNTNAARKAERG